ncbi:MAG TPA: FecR domain-containing protein [Candidatus Binatia bacterium]|jgi:hypothetical protein
MKYRLLIIALASMASSAYAGVGVVTGVQGDATVRHETAPQTKAVRFKDEAFWLDTYNTGAKSGLRLLVLDKSVITLKELSQMQLREENATPAQPKKKNVVNLVSGAARTVVEKDALKDSDYEIRTSRAIAGIKGSDLIGVIGTALNDQLQRAGLPRVPNNNCVAFVTGPGSTSAVVAPNVGNTDMGPLDLLIVCDQFTHNPVTANQFDDISNFLPPTDPPPDLPPPPDGGGGPPITPPGFPPSSPPARNRD